MAMPVVNWIKKNKLSSLLILILAFVLYKYLVVNTQSFTTLKYSNFSQDSGMMGQALPSVAPPFREVAPAPEVKDRLVVQNSQVSLLVKDVNAALTNIKTKVTGLGGYMVESSVSRPEEAASGQITVRVPAGKLDETLNFLRASSVKVVSENLLGEDVTDQYVDNDARLSILTANKERFEEIMKKATEIQDILEVQREIFNIQSQIDNIKGQQNFLAKTAQMAKLTAYLSTDELALPYAPGSPWRPEVIFKQAVRSLVLTLRGLAGNLIWLAVYGVLWVPLLLVAYLVYRVYKKLTLKASK